MTLRITAVLPLALLLAVVTVAQTNPSLNDQRVAADGKLYFASEDGDVFVVKAGPKYEMVATNPVGEVMMATPAISDGLVIVRGVNNLFAFGAPPAAKGKSGR